MQRHSVDRLLVAVLRLVFWFNPLLGYYDRAIQFNHECLADRAVIGNGYDLRKYQKSILENIQLAMPVTPAWSSELDFKFTKKRLMMLSGNQQSNKTLSWKTTVLLASWCLLAVACGNAPAETPNVEIVTEAPEQVVPVSAVPPADVPTTSHLNPFTSEALELQEVAWKELKHFRLEEWFQIWQRPRFGVWVNDIRVTKAELSELDPSKYVFYTLSELKATAPDYGEYRYQIDLGTELPLERWQISRAEFDARLRPTNIPPPPPNIVSVNDLSRPSPKTPSVEQWNSWQNPSEFGIWLDGQRIANEDLLAMDRNEIGYYLKSRLLPNAINYGQHTYQLDLSSRAAFLEWVAENWGEEH